MNKDAKALIQSLQLTPHPEGGYFREIIRSPDTVPSPHNQALRSAVTHIYFMLLTGQVSRLHRVCHDEIWNFYQGSPLELVDIHPNTLEIKRIRLGNPDAADAYVHCIRAAHWQAAIPTGEYTLMGCTVAPGFDFNDFEFMSSHEIRTGFLQLHPDQRALL